jgi:2'-5' RNA ligase
VIERRLRTFIAIELPPAVKHAIAAAQDTLRSALRDGGTSLKWVNPESAHLTLKFLGDTPESRVDEVAAALREAVGGSPALTLHTGAIGCFPSGRAPRVLWLGLEGDLEGLQRLRDAVEEHVSPLGWPDPQAGAPPRPFVPHLTLARLRPEATPAERRGVGQACGTIWPPSATELPVAEVSFMRSELLPSGPRYSALAQVALSSRATPR